MDVIRIPVHLEVAMINPLFAALAILLFALAVPLLKVHATQVFSPHRQEHAWLHGVFRLVTKNRRRSLMALT